MLPPAEPEADDEAWLAGVAREWRDELGDARQDIYSITDGRPPHEAGGHFSGPVSVRRRAGREAATGLDFICGHGISG